MTVLRFCLEIEYAYASTHLSCVALWVLWYVCVCAYASWVAGVGVV
jgi:hypothetical protein